MTFQLSCPHDGEKWWLGAVTDGTKMPVDAASEPYVFDGTVNRTGNQLCTLLVSDRGRYVYTEGGCRVEIGNGKVVLSDTVGDVDFGEGYPSLRDAYLAAADKHFFHAETAVPPILLLSPQYCSWVELLRDVDQEKTVAYAEGIKESGLPRGVLIIDDGWMNDYGEWAFREDKFPDPRKMCETLHALGFKVILWVCPFVNRGAKDFEMLERAGALVKDASGKTAFRNWWDGVSAVLDMTAPVAWAYLNDVLHHLMDDYGIDGFKFDAGDPIYYKTDDLTYAPTSPNGQSELWAQFAAQYTYSELRACMGLGGYPVVQRLRDKNSSWDANGGLCALIPDMIQAGLAGYPYCCPDMVGGGMESNFGEGKTHDMELFIRACQCTALMPMMQFSYAIWTHSQNDEVREIVKQTATLRQKHAPYIEELIEEARTTCAPLLRCLEYVYPHQGLSCVKDQFMLGDRLLVAPVLTKGATSRRVILPQGNAWRYLPTGEIYEGGQTVEVEAPLNVLPYFERV